MSSPFNVNMCGGNASESNRAGAGAAGYMSSFNSDMSMELELKSSPKQICIPLNQRQRMVSSETCLPSTIRESEMPDKSWSVLYVGTKKANNFE